MRALAFGILASLPAALPAQSVDDLAPARATRVWATGTFNGHLKGERNQTLYNGDRVHERIDCEIRMTFHPDGTVSYTTSDYAYEYQYDKKTTTGGYLVGRTTIQGMGGDGSRDATLQVSVTQDAKVWNAIWQPKVDIPADMMKEAWREEHGKTYGYAEPVPSRPTVSCEPKIFWRGRNGRGPGLPLQGSYQGPDVVHPWATVTADWSFRVR